jgi:hypothetical protein
MMSATEKLERRCAAFFGKRCVAALQHFRSHQDEARQQQADLSAAEAIKYARRAAHHARLSQEENK